MMTNICEYEDILRTPLSKFSISVWSLQIITLKYTKIQSIGDISAVSFENRKYDHFDIFYNKYIIMPHLVN